MSYLSTKCYGHEVGLSVAFRQHKAESHCRFIHGYALSVKLVFEAKEERCLDECGWVMDFGGLKEVKEYLQASFDHKLLVAVDDPMLDELCKLSPLGIAEVRVVPATGCEAFARQIFEHVDIWLWTQHVPRVDLASVEVSEHGANSAIYTRPKNDK